MKVRRAQPTISVVPGGLSSLRISNMVSNASRNKQRQTPDAFVDLEAGVDRQEVLESNDEEVDDFIEDADNEDDTSDAVDAPTTDPSAVTPLLGQSEVEDPWTELLDRARMRAIRGPTVGERHDDVSIHDVPPEFWVLTVFAGWEDVVVFHIGRCARPEHRIKAAFMMPVLEKQVWLEAEMSAMLKEWLKEIPGVCIRNQQPLIHSVSPQDGIGTPLTTKSHKPLVIGSWVRIRRGNLKGDTGVVSKVYPWGCKVLLVPRLDPSARSQKNSKRRRLDKLAPKLFDRGAIELDGTEKVKVVKQKEERYLWRGFVYEHDLLVRRVNFSQVELVREIPDILAGLFCQSRHPLVRRHRKHLPRISEWCLVVGDPVMDTSNGRVGLVSSVGDERLEIECEEGLFPLAWAHCRKTFEVGQYVEITEELIDRWAGWIDAIEDGIVHVVSHQTRTKDEVKMREVHPNLLMVSTPPSSLPPAPKKDQELIRPTKNISWKGTLVTITRPHHRWRGKTGYVEDVNVSNNSYGRPGLRVLVRLAAYDPNMPYPDAWFDYLDVIDEETHLPLNEALPLADNDDNLYHKYVPVTHFLEERGRRVRPEPEPQSEADPGNRTPLPDPSERCLSPAWDPSAPEPGSSMVVSSPTYWCTDQRLHGYKFRAIYHGLKISAAVRANSIGGGGLKCVRDDTSAREELDPAAVLPIHPTSRHYDLFLVISGEHCGKWVRGIQFKKGTSQDRSDLEWTVAVVIPRAPYLQDDLTDERLVLHSSCMTLADESAQERKLNDSLKRLLRKPARER
ncbi:hypothetical protein EDD18DRAFT_1356434 [Armillaria luteobubalina]|uniref:Chromatin elongation factor spt5 n=1 Tax=Armillaria luteobubalina TaxID=153913 RepID=A0AA39UKV3_9AGAR|nr:hypothetical protein EDD18DRAFT_1356434 [Armillaria luteobubalina]